MGKNYAAMDKDGFIGIYSGKPIRNEKLGVWQAGKNSKFIRKARESECIMLKLTWELPPIPIDSYIIP